MLCAGNEKALATVTAIIDGMGRSAIWQYMSCSFSVPHALRVAVPCTNGFFADHSQLALACTPDQ